MEQKIKTKEMASSGTQNNLGQYVRVVKPNWLEQMYFPVELERNQNSTNTRIYSF
jgi:hypothetical protein